MTIAGPRPGREPLWRSDVVKALLATLVPAAVAAAGGFERELAAHALEDDSLLRLVEVRDLIAGQNWFNLHQYPHWGQAAGC